MPVRSLSLTLVAHTQLTDTSIACTSDGVLQHSAQGSGNSRPKTGRYHAMVQSNPGQRASEASKTASIWQVSRVAFSDHNEFGQ